jgi:serine protease AprX
VVGATNSADQIAGFSSRGPVAGRVGPDLVAPGVAVCSATRNSASYHYLNGTSMAAPHVSGLVALLIGMRGCLRGEVERIESLLRQTAQPLLSGETCGDVPGSVVPNNTFGHGLARGVLPGCYVAGGALFCDGFEQGDQQAWCPQGTPPLVRLGMAASP